MKRAQNTRLRAVCFRAARSVAFFLLLLFSLNSGTASASPFEDSVRILEDRTAFHWGRDCFVWVVHYSEELVDPWVEAEAGRVGMSDSEREAYKNSFMSDLSMGEAEPLLVTVHAFGAAPLNLSPFSDKIALVTPSGERVKPVRYDRIFDQPLSGVVQGLIFFPKQQDPDFAVAMNGLGVFDERVFAFARENLNYDYPVTPVQPVEEETEVIIVELPPAPPPPAPRPQPPQPRPQPPAPRPQPPAPAPTPPPAPAPQTPPPAPVPPPAPAAAEPPEPEVVVVEPESPQNEENERDVAYSSREQTLRRFLDLWIRYDPAAMYLMLSDSSREALSRRAFEEELRKSADFRNAIRDGYTIDWTGSEQGKVVVIRRFLFIRTLLSRNFGLVREGSAWKIVW